MKNLTIRHKLWLVIIAILLALAAIKGTSAYFQQRIQLAMDTRHDLDRLTAQFLALRQAQTNFIFSKELRYAEQFTTINEQIQNSRTRLQRQLVTLQLDTEALQAANQHLQAYLLSFRGVVERQKAIGLDHTAGLYGDLRKQAHEVEAVVEGYPALMASLLMLRRHEKDFMLRRLDKYPARFMTGLSDFRGLLFMSTIDNATMARAQGALRDYADAFETLVQNEREIGLDRSSGLLGGMQARVKETEAAIEAMNRSVADRIDAYIGEADVLSSAIVLAMMTDISLLLLWLQRDLGRSLARAGASAQGLAQGDWHSPIKARRSDEVGALLQTFESMRVALLEKTEALEADGRLKSDLAELATVIRGQTALTPLAESVIRFIVPKLGGHVGAIYSSEESGLAFLAGYGIQADDFPDTIAIGEGMTGQCAAEQRVIRVSPVPAGYLPVVSGTGSSSPGTVITAPLVWQERLYGVVELGGLGGISDYADVFLHAAGEAIAIAVNSCRVSEEMQGLLQDSLTKSDALEAEQRSARQANQELAQKAEQLQASEEELRVQQEELQAQAEELRVTNEELEAQTRLLHDRTRELQTSNRQLRDKLGGMA
ncbi:MAG: HAMP domain-containing protein [Alcanivoracaceae bacterium]|nr:HAMP domain-containing protein [Alcanivoracaceae bacterium]